MRQPLRLNRGTIRSLSFTSLSFKPISPTDGKGADQLLEVVGGEGLNDSVEATKITGQIAVIGILARQTTNFHLMRVIFKETKIQGNAVGHLTALRQWTPISIFHKALLVKL